jgi:hypothetical protein
MGALAAAVSFVPGIGGVLSTGLVAYASHGGRERIYALIADLTREVGRVGEAKVDHDFLESEEFLDLELRAFRIASETGNAEKRRWCAAILAGSISVDRPHELDHEALLGAIGSLSAQTLVVARECYLKALANAPPEYTNPVVEPPKGEYGQFFLDQLRAAGLLYEQSRAVYETENISEFRVAPALRSLMELVGTDPGDLASW